MVKFEELNNYFKGKKYDGDLRPLLSFMDDGSESDAWKIAGFVCSKSKKKSSLSLNADCVAIAKYLHKRDTFMFRTDHDVPMFGIVSNFGIMHDNHHQKSNLSIGTSIKSMYTYVDVASPFHLPLGAGVVDENKRNVMTLVDVGYNRDNGWAVFVGKLSGKDHLIHVLGNIPKDHDIPWTTLNYSAITAEDLPIKRGKAWFGKLVYTT